MSVLSWGRLFLPSSTTADLYNLMSTTNHLGERSMYQNLGYWEKTGTYDDACQALAEHLGLAAELGPKDEVLDCGFGFADQDMFWMERFKPKRIVGLNIAKSQVEIARKRIADKGLSDRIDLRYGSATAMPLGAATFDKVVALETAFHYDTREDFFKEAFRVLRPGGRLVTVDIVPGEVLPAQNMFAKIEDFAGRFMWKIPKVNMYPGSVYKTKLEDAGFTKVETRSIRNFVYPQFAKFATERIQDAAMKQVMSPVVRELWKGSLRQFVRADGPDYIVAIANKPA